jgi:hypothetical protein
MAILLIIISFITNFFVARLFSEQILLNFIITLVISLIFFYIEFKRNSDYYGGNAKDKQRQNLYVVFNSTIIFLAPIIVYCLLILNSASVVSHSGLNAQPTPPTNLPSIAINISTNSNSSILSDLYVSGFQYLCLIPLSSIILVFLNFIFEKLGMTKSKV